MGGEVRVLYELHSFRSGAWYRVKAWEGKEDAISAGEQVLGNRTVDGYRVARVRHYVDHEFIDSIIVFKRFQDGVVESDPLLAVTETEHVGAWKLIEDLYKERSRDDLRAHLARYLEEKRLTTIEVLHSDRHFVNLDSAGTYIQGMMQKLAVIQARVSNQSSAVVFKDLMQLAANAVAQVRTDTERLAPPRLEPGRFLAVYRAFEARYYSGEALAYQLYRCFAAYLLPAESWLAKLDLIGGLVEPELEPRHLRLLDSMLAEIFQMHGPYREIIDEGGGRPQMMRTIADFCVGRYTVPRGNNPPGIQAINWLLAQGGLPRTRAVVRRRLLREAHSRVPMVSGADLLTELDAVATTFRHMAEISADLARDEELQLAFELRAGRALTPESVSGCLSTQQRIVDKVKMLARIMVLTPGEANRGLVCKFFRAFFAPDDVVRQAMRDGGTRLNALSPLVELQRLLAGSPLDSDVKGEIITALDTAVLDIFKTDILNAQNRTYIDRVLALVRVTGALPMVDGRARAFVSEIVSREVKNPKFLPAYLGKCKDERERAEAVLNLRTLLNPAGR